MRRAALAVLLSFLVPILLLAQRHAAEGGSGSPDRRDPAPVMAVDLAVVITDLTHQLEPTTRDHTLPALVVLVSLRVKVVRPARASEPTRNPISERAKLVLNT